MDLAAFYGLLAGTSFTLVGLWWTIVQRHEKWKTDLLKRKLAGATYLSFLLPGLMSTLATVGFDQPLLWRTTFAVTSLIGLVTTVRLIRIETTTVRGPFRRNRWLVAVSYLLILVLGVVPEVVRGLGLPAVQVAGVLLVILIVLGHGLTWEFLMEPDEGAV